MERVLCWVCFVRLPCANIATAMPTRQNRHAVKMRRLKKADCAVDFFFIDEVGFSLRSRVVMLSVMLEACQHFFKFFTKSYSRTRLCRTATYAQGCETTGLPLHSGWDDLTISDFSDRRSVFLVTMLLPFRESSVAAATGESVGSAMEGGALRRPKQKRSHS